MHTIGINWIKLYLGMEFPGNPMTDLSDSVIRYVDDPDNVLFDSLRYWRMHFAILPAKRMFA